VAKVSERAIAGRLGTGSNRRSSAVVAAWWTRVPVVAVLSLVAAVLLPLGAGGSVNLAAVAVTAGGVADVTPGCPDSTVSPFGPIPAPGSPVPGAPECFKISIPDLSTGVPKVVSVPDGTGTPRSGDRVAIAAVPVGAIVSGMYWTLVTQGNAGSYWASGTSYRLKLYGTNLCMHAKLSLMYVADCATAPAVFNITARTASAEQIQTGVFGTGKVCMTAGLASGAIFAGCDKTSMNQAWVFSGPAGWLTTAQLKSAALVCPHDGVASTGCGFQSALTADRTARVANSLLPVNACATDPLGNLLPPFQAPEGIPASGGYSYSHAVTGGASTSSTYSNSLSKAVAFSYANTITVAQATGLHTQSGSVGIGYDNNNYIEIKDTTWSDANQFQVSATGTGTVQSTFNLATSGSAGVTATIPSIPPGDTAWFSVLSNFVTVSGTVIVPGSAGNYSIPVPDYILPVVPGVKQAPDSSQVPVNLAAGSPVTSGIVQGHYATSYSTVAPDTCTPVRPTITPGVSLQLTNAASELSLGAHGGDCEANGNTLVQYQYFGTPDQKWTPSTAGDGTYTLGSDCAKSLTVPNYSTIAGTQLTEATITGGTNQRWRLVPVYGTDYWSIRSYSSNLFATAQDSTVSASIVQKAADTAVSSVVGAYVPGPAQQWKLTPSPATVAPQPPDIWPNAVEDGSYQIINVGSSLSLSATGSACADGAGLVQNRYLGTRDQRWNIKANANGTYTLTNDCTLVVTDPKSSTTAGIQLIQAGSDGGGIDQQWVLTPVAGTNSFTINSWASNRYAGTASDSTGATVVQNDFESTVNGLSTSSPRQRWILKYTPPVQVLVDGASYRVTNSLSGLALGTNGSCAASTGLSQTSYRASSDQVWTFTSNGDAPDTLANGCGLAMEDPATGNQEGLPIIQSTPGLATTQRWIMISIRASDTTTWNMVNARSGQYVTAESSGEGGKTIRRKADYALDQQWVFGRLPVATVQPSLTTQQDRPLAITLAGTGDGTITSYAVVAGEGPTHGTLSRISSTGAVIYNPDTGFPSTEAPATDSFQFTVTDNRGLTSHPATVTIAVEPVAPSAISRPKLATQLDKPLTVTLTGTGVDYPIADYGIVAGTGPASGTLSNISSTGVVTYTAKSGFVGTDSFKFTVTDSRGLTSAPATVTITVQVSQLLLRRGYKVGTGHVATTRPLPDGFILDATWHLLDGPVTGTRKLYECKVGGHSLLTPDPGCEGLPPLGAVGNIYTSQVAESVPLYRCYVPATGDHFVSGDASCGGRTKEALLGYALR